MSKKVISTPQAPDALGPYSQAIQCGDFVFCSGQIPIDPSSGDLVEGDIGEQTRQVLENLTAVLKAAHLELSNVVKTSVFLTNLDDFPRMNEVYAEFFPQHPPARATVEVSRLPAGVAVEIECVAMQ